MLFVLCRYKAYFRWGHYPYKLKVGPTLPDETEACASVTSAFLQASYGLRLTERQSIRRWYVQLTSLLTQVLNTLFVAESRRLEGPRNVLQVGERMIPTVEAASTDHCP